MKSNESLGIYKVSSELTEVLIKLSREDSIEINNYPTRIRQKLGRMAIKTGLIEYVPLIKKKKGFTILTINNKKVVIQKTD